MPSSNGPRLLGPQQNKGIRTRVLLIAAMAVIIACTTGVSLLTVRHRVQQIIRENLTADLIHSIATFDDMQAQRAAALERENALLADLPTLKALMTTSDQRTIADDASYYSKLGGNELFALASRDGKIAAIEVAGNSIDPGLKAELETTLGKSARPFVISGGQLFACSVRPIYFGSVDEGTVLGYVISGYPIDRKAVEKLGSSTGVDAVFSSNGRVLVSSLGGPPGSLDLGVHGTGAAADRSEPAQVTIGSEHYLAVARNLSASASVPLELIELKSLDQEERSIQEIDKLVVLAGVIAFFLGTALMLALSRSVTKPLEELDAGVRAFAAGDSSHILPYGGTLEVRELSQAFAGMRREILQANQALLESERLATIGRMANSVSHDLRHYLAAVYANSEFLASGHLSDDERNEILGEIRTAVNGTTELLESLLIFSRSGPGIRRTHQQVSALLERALIMAKAHPDAAKVVFSIHEEPGIDSSAVVDGKQVERAIYNLLLNACQAPHSSAEPRSVTMSMNVRQGDVILDVVDNGDGVPENIRTTLFDPFVSEGKQKGSGLGLTLAQCIAREHGGDVTLVSSHFGETIFRISFLRGLTEPPNAPQEERARVRAV